MKQLWIGMAIVVAAAFGWLARTGFTEDAPEAPQDPMMAEMMRLGQPGEQHKYLEPLVGTWDVDSSMWNEPGAAPQLSKATSTIAWVLGGRFLRQEYQGEMEGMPFHGLGYTGFDNYKKQFVGTWMDSWSTNYMPVSGPPSEDGKKIQTSGKWEGPMGTYTFRYVLEVKSQNEHIMTMYMTQGGGEEMKHMELVYRRKAE